MSNVQSPMFDARCPIPKQQSILSWHVLFFLNNPPFKDLSYPLTFTVPRVDLSGRVLSSLARSQEYPRFCGNWPNGLIVRGYTSPVIAPPGIVFITVGILAKLVVVTVRAVWTIWTWRRTVCVYRCMIGMSMRDVCNCRSCGSWRRIPCEDMCGGDCGEDDGQLVEKHFD